MSTRVLILGMVASIAVPLGALGAQSTKTYNYDALGRLTQSTTAGGQQDGTVNAIQYDSAGNRVNYQVTGVPASQSGPATSPSSPAASTPMFIVVPLNGFTLIPVHS